MVSKNKAKGTRYEKDVFSEIVKRGYWAELLRPGGSRDPGDIVMRDGKFRILELKATRRHDIADALSQAKAEAETYGSLHNIETPLHYALFKRPNKSVLESYVIQTLEQFLDR